MVANITNKWINSALNYEAYFFERVSSEHKIVSAKIRLSLSRSKKQKVKQSIYGNITNVFFRV